MTENKVGKQVYAALPHEGKWDINIDTTKVWTIVDAKNCDEADDWCDHYIIKDEDLNEREVGEYEVVIAPDFGLPEEERLAKYLNDNRVYAEVWKHDDDILVNIVWGDWKHEHLWAKTLMEYINYLQLDVEVTEEDGSDTYSAVHTYHEYPESYVKFFQAYRRSKFSE